METTRNLIYLSNTWEHDDDGQTYRIVRSRTEVRFVEFVENVVRHCQNTNDDDNATDCFGFHFKYVYML